MKDIRELLQTRPLLFDGAMGTYYKAAPGVECEQANLTDPAGVLAVHREYLAAGADAVKTNTFSLPRLAAAHTPGWEQLAQAGWQLAVQAAEETGAAVFADLGPAPDTEAVPAGQVYTAVAKQFAALGARNFLFETLSSDAGLLDAVGAIKAEVPDAFVLVSFAVLPDGYTREGMYCKDLARRMQESGIVDAVGLNCVSAPGAMRTLAKQLGGTLPLSVMPNAGYPVVTRTQVKYQGRPEYFARELGRLAAEGTVQILGGCCGTTPAHIAALRAELDSLPVVEKTAPTEEFSTVKEQTVENEDAFLRKLNAGEKVIAIELDSPRNADLTGYSYELNIFGGTITAHSDSGDGFDSNGDLTISGGYVTVWTANTADNEPLDADGTVTVSGGTVLAAGGSGGMGMSLAAAQPCVIFGGTTEMPGENVQNGQPGAGGQPNGKEPPSGEERPDGEDRPAQGGFGGASLLTQNNSFTIANSDGAALYTGEAAYNASFVFFSSADGSTQGAGDVWMNDLPYLQKVDSPETEELVPNYYSVATFTAAEFKSLVPAAKPDADLSGSPEGWIRDIVRNDSDYVASVTVGGVKLRGNDLRTILSLRSPSFTVEYKDNAFTFHVTGYGHGVGMSQYGANILAKQGLSAEEIVQHYFSNTTVGYYDG